MNKKRLSVVMAGAMLASAVAPVMAAEVQKSEVSANELGLLIKKVRETLESKKFANDTVADQKANKEEAGLSVYYVKVNGVEYRDAALDSQEKLQTIFGNLKTGATVEIWSKGFVEKEGKYYANTEVVPTYANVKELSNLSVTVSNVVKEAKFDDKTDKFVITFEENVGLKPVELKVGSEKLDFDKFKNVTTGKIDEIANATAENFGGFVTVNPELDSVADEKVEEITITTGGNDLAVEDLYDGLMLTTAGHDFLSEMKYYDKADNNADKDVTVGDVSLIKGTNKYRFTVEFNAVESLPAKEVTITGTDKANTERLAKWLEDRLAKVDILAGDNRYATAVKIAEEYADLDEVYGKNDKEGNIVLVNGNALVDGLAAAPLAESLNANESSKTPILLTESDKLPRETKDYLFRVLKNIEIGNLKNVKITIVGGNSVVSKGLERELSSLGFEVERLGGDNREETSLEVADAIYANNSASKGKAFLVGAHGEADAMSIAPVAAENETPIIVGANNGVSEDAINELKGANVTVIGGENAVSKSDFESLKSKANTVLRVAGKNRKDTNAAIINKYYEIDNTKNVIVSKDGQNNKTELVDALAAANMASEKKAPIVLATDKLSDTQINALELKAKDAKALYQVGHGVARDVVKTIAQRLGLTN